MRFPTLLTLLVGIYIHSAQASYQLTQDYSGDQFFDGWDFYSGEDYTHGFVDYLSSQDAGAQGLISVQSGGPVQKQAYMGVDFTHQTPNGRPSVRLESKLSVNQGLIVADFAHAPGGLCGTWPAFWLVGSNWPNGGEIDIIEGVHEQSQNAMTLHTKAGLSYDSSSASLSNSFSGKMTTGNCDVAAPNQPTNSGCSIQDATTESYGTGFNAIGGGVYATQWTASAVKIWFFPRNKIPKDIQAGQPMPGETWGKPSASFSGDMNKYFNDQKIILDTTFCGDWAGAAWEHSTCKSKAPTCNAYVRDNPSAFQEAYWLVNYIRVYQDQSPPSSTSTPTSTALSTTHTHSPDMPTTSTTSAPAFSSSSTAVSTSPKRTRTKTEVITVTPTPSQSSTSASRPHRIKTEVVTVTVTGSTTSSPTPTPSSSPTSSSSESLTITRLTRTRTRTVTSVPVSSPTSLNARRATRVVRRVSGTHGDTREDRFRTVAR